VEDQITRRKCCRAAHSHSGAARRARQPLDSPPSLLSRHSEAAAAIESRLLLPLAPSGRGSKVRVLLQRAILFARDLEFFFLARARFAAISPRDRQASVRSRYRSLHARLDFDELLAKRRRKFWSVQRVFHGLGHAITLGSVGDRAKDCTRYAAPATASLVTAVSHATSLESRRPRVVIEP
jgi:hypothetical protein